MTITPALSPRRPSLRVKLRRLLYRITYYVDACSTPDCAKPSRPPDQHCLTHIIDIRDHLGDQRCRDSRSRCVQPRFGRASQCREHFEESTFNAVLDNGQHPPPRYRRATTVEHRRPVEGLEMSYVIYSDPAASEYPHGPVTHRTGADRQRLYLYGYINGDQIGHLSAWLHPGATIRIRKIDVDHEHRRKGIASALYETLRTEHPGALVDHGVQSDDAKAWWDGYCSVRGLDPEDPRS